jgi:hypothetical protein
VGHQVLKGRVEQLDQAAYPDQVAPAVAGLDRAAAGSREVSRAEAVRVGQLDQVAYPDQVAPAVAGLGRVVCPAHSPAVVSREVSPAEVVRVVQLDREESPDRAAPVVVDLDRADYRDRRREVVVSKAASLGEVLRVAPVVGLDRVVCPAHSRLRRVGLADFRAEVLLVGNVRVDYPVRPLGDRVLGRCPDSLGLRRGPVAGLRERPVAVVSGPALYPARLVDRRLGLVLAPRQVDWVRRLYRVESALAGPGQRHRAPRQAQARLKDARQPGPEQKSLKPNHSYHLIPSSISWACCVLSCLW